MKKIFTSIALLACATFVANAQKNADLEINFNNIVDDQVFPNVPMGDVLEFEFEILNHGPADLVAGDTVYIYLRGHCVSTEDVLYYIYSGVPVGDGGIPAGSGGYVTFSIEQGYSWSSSDGSTTLIYFFPNNAVHKWLFDEEGREDVGEISYYVGIEGSSSGTPFNDPGTLYDAEGELLGWEGNNEDILRGITFGNPGGTSIWHPSAKNQNLNVYPNPASQSISFTYNFESATNAVVTVMDITGKVVLTKDFGKVSAGEQNFTINVAELAAGNYTLELHANNIKGVSKFTVSK